MPNDSTHPSQPGLTTSETIETLLQRRSIRKYSDAPVTDAQVDAISASRLSRANIVQHSIIHGHHRPRPGNQKLSVPAGNQKHIVDCPVFLAFCADLTRLEHVLQERGHTLEDNNLEIGLVSSIDASLVGMSAYLAADLLGIKGVMIGAVRNDAVEIAEILELPKFVYCVFGMCRLSGGNASKSRVWTKISPSIGRNSSRRKSRPRLKPMTRRSVRITNRSGRRRRQIHGATTWIRNSIRSCVMAFATTKETRFRL